MSRDTDNEMRQIQQGLEAFLQQELREMESRGIPQKSEPQLYTIEEEETEEELDIIGDTSGRRKQPARRSGNTGYYEQDDYEDYDSNMEEDWDSPIKRTGKGSRQSRDAGAGSRSSSGGSRPAGNRGTSRNQKSAKAPGRQPGADHYGGSGRTPSKSGRQPSQKGPERPRKGSGKKRGRGLKKFLITAVLLIALAGGGLYYLVGSVYGKMNFEPIDSVAGLPMQEDGVINVLLIGNDSRQNSDDGRSDAMILISVSSKTKSIYMTSLLRDMYVEIPGHDGNRLNAAYSFGGAELLMETVEKNLDIPVNRYVLVNFEAFAKLVDAVGGVDLELTTEELEYVNGYLMEYNMLTDRPQGTDNMDTTRPGMVHLNGPQALAYCRNRYIGTDFGRTERQRKVLTAVIGKLSGAMGSNYQELLEGLMPNLTTNLTQAECYRLSLMAGKLLTYDIVSDSIPQPDTYQNATIRKMAVLEVDFEANIKYLKEKIYGETGE